MKIIYQKTEFYIYMQCADVHFAISLVAPIFDYLLFCWIAFLFFKLKNTFLKIVSLKTKMGSSIQNSKKQKFLDVYLLIFHAQWLKLF